MAQLAGFGFNPKHHHGLHVPCCNLYYSTDKKRYPKYGIPACYWTKYQAKKRLESVTDYDHRFDGYQLKIFKLSRFYKPYQIVVINSASLSADYKHRVKLRQSMQPMEVISNYLQAEKQQRDAQIEPNN